MIYHNVARWGKEKNAMSDKKEELLNALCEWSNKWVGDFINDKIIPYANEALKNPCFCKILESWKEAHDDLDRRRKRGILTAIKEDERLNDEDVLLKTYKEKAARYDEMMYEFFRDGVFGK